MGVDDSCVVRVGSIWEDRAATSRGRLREGEVPAGSVGGSAEVLWEALLPGYGERSPEGEIQ